MIRPQTETFQCAAAPLPSRGGAGGGVCNFNGRSTALNIPSNPHNLRHNPVDARPDLLVAEPDDPDTLLAEERRPLLVVLEPVVVRTAVQLHAEPQLGAVEVEHVGADTLLPTELPAARAPAPQSPPQRGLGWRHVPAQRLARVLLLRMVGFRGVVVHDDSFLLVTDPHPRPLPYMGGERLRVVRWRRC